MIFNLRRIRKKNINLVSESGLFDSEYYLKNYPDIKQGNIDPLKHYLLFGGFEGRNPSEKFNTIFYLKTYPDVIREGINPLIHYILFGKSEGRKVLREENIKKPEENSLFSEKAVQTEKKSENTTDPLMEEIELVRKSVYFDKEYYLAEYPDIREKKSDPAEHFFKFGFKELRNPSEKFNTKFYLEKYPDVKDKGVNPLVHYIRFGKSEGRITLSETKNIEEKNSEKAELPTSKTSDESMLDMEVQNTIRDSGLFDADYYITNYPDIKYAGVDPLEHYCRQGWKEGRNPGPKFDTKFYINSNPDVRNAFINPLFHYLSSGIKEGRDVFHPCKVKVDVLRNTYAEISLQKTMNKLVVDVKDSTLLKKVLLENSIGSKGVVFSFSHDKYVEIVGGIQLCIIEEQKEFTSDSYCYIHFSPTRFKYEFINQNLENTDLNVIINGDFIGIFEAKVILDLVSEFFSETRNHVVIHALHGHNLEFILEFYKVIKIMDVNLWLHDFFSICSNHKITRNNVEYCGAPDVESNACSICLFGNKRSEHLQKMKTLFETLHPSIVSPSHFALNLWKSLSDFPYGGSHIVEHRKISHSYPEISGLKKKHFMRVGFIGYPLYHKGWSVFIELVERLKSSQKYKFYHIGLRNTFHPDIEFVESSISVENPDQTTKTIKDLKLDFAFIWALWPETFCLVAFEAILASALVITHNKSGNVPYLINQYRRGIIYKDTKELFRDFESDRIFEHFIELNKSGIPFYGYQKSKYTYGIIKD